MPGGTQKTALVLCGGGSRGAAEIGFLNLQSRAFHIATRQKLSWDMERLKDKADLVVLAPCLTFAAGILDFSQSERIMDEAYRYARSVLPARVDAGR